MNLGELLSRAKTMAQQTGIAETDYRYIMSVTLDLAVPQMLLNREMPISEPNEAELLARFKRLSLQEAPQYICGCAYFYGHKLKVSRATLIPRPETEGLVELVLQHVSGNARILDIGTGSGAIAIALKLAKPTLCMDAIDISEEALEVARSNAKLLKAKITFYHGDLFPSKAAAYDIIVSNPPYVSLSEHALLESRVKDNEPALALLAGTDGLDVFREILAKAGDFLNSNGLLAVEHGNTQQKAIMELALVHGWKIAGAYTDLCGRERYLVLRVKKCNTAKDEWHVDDIH
ncbi:MAG: peptide chain release factor N(5)-glutamine methyltransferase [Candidatus Cloacimonas sp.]|jgi:release factor glutamine methyltransferase|nr:peptide chain release factor N(5)-glutamine methyltransferase [Candidatus Cloacimonas sp.]